MFQLSKEEVENLRFQIGTSSLEHGGTRYLPYAFTEHGVAMLSSVLNSERAIEMNIFIIRAFIKMRESLDQYKDLSIKIGEIETKQKEHGVLLVHVHGAVKELISKSKVEKPVKPKGKIGFRINKE
jgi:phage regulator Rha-like protein